MMATPLNIDQHKLQQLHKIQKLSQSWLNVSRVGLHDIVKETITTALQL